ncbi:MAG: MFS transporter [SAR324 cluster bacterium]|uniref:MFS transporter n=1 Tax=SAR324 cluster bacterium TaxID=2024889 RepID=A0A7X9FSR6_9DELT|nr:MFS transporter [SAR324 cluster bacterium]
MRLHFWFSNIFNRHSTIKRQRLALFRAFYSRNYRLFFFGQAISLIGSWITQVATSWLVYRLTHDPFMLGLIIFSGQMPAFIFTPFAGVLIDRFNLHRIIIATQVVSMLQSTALAVLTLSSLINIPLIFFLYFIQGVVNALDIPARQAFVLQLVDNRNDLPNAIALNSSVFNGARLIGPAIAGILIAAFGEGLCYAIDAISYVAVIAALLSMHLEAKPRTQDNRNLATEFKEGLMYLRSFPSIRVLLAMLALITLSATSYITLMPVFTSEVLHSGPQTLGLLISASGLGAFVAALWLAARRDVRGLLKRMPMISASLGISLITFSFSNSICLSVVSLFLSGFFMISHTASSNTLLQTLVDDDKRGRIMSFYAMAFQGTMPLGGLVAGILADSDLLGPQLTIMWGGLLCLIAALSFWHEVPNLQSHIRPIYVNKGIISANMYS